MTTLDVLLGYEIRIFTDHKPLLGLFSNTLPPGKLGRWALIIQEYQAKFFYKPGKCNDVPDALSRYPIEEENAETEYGFDSIAYASCQAIDEEDEMQNLLGIYLYYL